MPKKQLRVKRAPTKQQLSRWQREKKIQRITLYAGISIISLVLLFILFGFYDRELRPLRKPALKVNDTLIRSDYYISVLKIIAQSDNPVAKANMADYALDFLRNNELIKQAATKMGVVVTPSEMAETARKTKLPLEQDLARDLLVAELFTKKARDNIASTVPQRAEQAHIMQIVTDNKDEAEAIRDRLRAGEDFASMARQVSQDLSSKEKGGELGWFPRELLDKNIADTAFKIEPGTISEPVKPENMQNFHILKVIERKEDMEISAENREKMISLAVSYWLSGLIKEATIEVYLNEKDKLRALDLARRK